MKPHVSLPVVAALIATSSVAEASSSAMCFQTSRVIKAGEVLSEDAVASTDCVDELPGQLRGDRKNSLFVAIEEMEEGRFLGRIRPAPAKTIAPGARLTFVTVDGPVRIEREVVALESARPGQRLFVQGNDGAPFAVTYQPHSGTGG